MSQPTGGNPEPPPPTSSSWGPTRSSGEPATGIWGAPPPAAPQPGVIPLRPLSIGEILDGAITTMRRYPKPMLGLSFVVTAMLTSMTFLVSVAQQSSLSRLFDVSGAPFGAGQLFTVLGGNVALVAVSTLLEIVATGVLVGMLSAVVGEAVRGRQTSISAAWASIRHRIWRVIGLALVLTVLIGLGLALCLVPGVVALTFWCIAPAALVLERGTVLGSIGRAGALVSGAFWRTLGVVVLLAVIYLVLNAALTAPFFVLSVLFGPPDALFGSGWQFLAQQAFVAIGRVAAGTVGCPFVASAIALLYVDQRIRREGLASQLGSVHGQP